MIVNRKEPKCTFVFHKQGPAIKIAETSLKAYMLESGAKE
jgi:hypothetical protein